MRKRKLRKYLVTFRGSHDRENGMTTTVMAYSQEEAEAKVQTGDPALTGVCFAREVKPKKKTTKQ